MVVSARSYHLNDAGLTKSFLIPHSFPTPTNALRNEVWLCIAKFLELRDS